MGGQSQIGEVAERTELSISTIRHYDQFGLVVPSARSHGGFRLYTESDIDRLLVIRRMKPLGFSLEQMRELLDATHLLSADAAPTPERERELREIVRRYRDLVAERRRQLVKELAIADEFTATLNRLGSSKAE